MSDREFEFTDKQFKKFQKLILEHTSITISDEKKELIYGRIARRLRKLNLDSFEDYFSIVDSSGSEELESFVNAVTTNLTSFFREKHHFEHLKSTVIPGLLEHNFSSKKIRIWSAGCSTGEEPYSIAMTLMESIPDIHTWDVKILATDIDTEVLSTAMNGVYREDRIDGLSKAQVKQWFKRGKGAKAGYVRVAPELQELISFKQLNLLKEWPFRGPFDILFCRNVVIYFDKPTQKVLFKKFAEVVPSYGEMFIGHSETLHNVSEDFKLMGHTVYQKCA
ncbi:MAG: protein-glutamate O-methyltransferase CheR [Gammaproteobacteria bacterium]